MPDQTKWCPRCQQDVPISDWYRNAARSDGLSAYCRPCYAALNEDLRRRDRAELLAALGGRCERCGFDDARALQVDHVVGGKRETMHRHGKKWTRHVLANRVDFQLLCANCNTIKRIEEGEHIGARDYGRVPPTERVVRPDRRSDPDVIVLRTRGLRRFQAERTDEQETERRRKISESRRSMSPEARAEQSRKISEARRGTKRGPDGKWYRPDQ